MTMPDQREHGSRLPMDADDIASRKAVRDQLVAERLRRGATLERFVSQSGLSRAAVQKFGRDRYCRKSLGTWVAYANALGFSLALTPDFVPGYRDTPEAALLEMLGGDDYAHAAMLVRLAAVRERAGRGWTASAARRVGVSASWVRRVEEREPAVMGVETLQRYVRAFGGTLRIELIAWDES